jgi:UDP-glucose 4-epimerase
MASMSTRTSGTRQRRDPIHLTRNYLNTRSHSRWLTQKALNNSVKNLVPIVINKLKAGQPPVIYGTDYPTPDGTCIRDYVDVRDIARAHLAAADSTATLPLAMNVGTGRGGSVREVIKLVCAAAGKSDVVADEKGRRAEDPAFICADVSLIKRAIGFSSKYSLEESTGSLFF